MNPELVGSSRQFHATEFGRMTTEVAAEDDHQQGRAFTSQRPQRDRGSARPAPLHIPSTQLLDHDRPGVATVR